MYKLKKIFKNEKGQGMVEYGLILATVSIVAILGLSTLGGNIKDQFEGITDSMDISEPGPGYSDEEIDDLIKEGYIPVATADELNNVRNATVETYGEDTKWKGEYTGGLEKQYVQVLNIDLSGYGDWTPIGSYTSWSNKSPFIGSFDGNGHKITGLTINRPETDYVGLFRYTKKATISNVALEDVDVTGKEAVGGLVGYATDKTTISNSYATGSVTGKVTGIRGSAGGLVGSASTDGTGYGPTISNSYFTGSVTGAGYNVGGLVGYADMATISNSYAEGSVESTSNQVGGLVGNAGDDTTISSSYATGTVKGNYYVGGLVGHTNSRVTISDSYATGSVTGTGERVGGLVGEARGSTIKNSYAEGSVSGASEVGGLMGWTNDSNISSSYATGEVTGNKYVGGLVGWPWENNTISNSYATGAVTGTTQVGGLVGHARNSTISNTYATGSVTGTNEVGGLAGLAGRTGSAANIPVISNSYWDTGTTGQDTSAGEGEGKSTVDMKSKDTYEGWDFDTVWEITPGNYPTLR